MLSVSARLSQTPVLLSSSCANISECQMIPLVGHVVVNSSRMLEIGGIKGVWEAQVQRRRRKRGGKYCWTKGDIFDRFEVDVLSGPSWLPPGESVFEFVIEVPVTLPSSRTTHYDKIAHKLHATVLVKSPCYDQLNDNKSSLPDLTPLLRRILPKQSRSSMVFGSTPILVQTVEPVNVFSCGAEGGSTSYDWRYNTGMNGLGHLSVCIDSQQFVLGGSADLTIDLTDLSPTTTIHSITASLVQTTSQATCPSKYSAEQSISASDIVIPTELSDKYELYSYGTSWSRMPGRIRPYRGSYIWRGPEAAQYVNDRVCKVDLGLDRLHRDGFGLSTNLTIPSPIIGAHPTNITDNPAFSTIAHHLEVQLEYSILNQDLRGDRVTPIDVEPVEGSVRTWTLEKALQLHSDLSSATATAAPPYSRHMALPEHCSNGRDIDLDSIKAPRSISLGWTNATLMRPVRIDQQELRRQAGRHWEETSGMCACFVKSHARGCDSFSDGLHIPGDTPRKVECLE